MKGNPESGKVLLVEAGIQQFLLVEPGIHGFWDSEYSTRNPESHDQLQSRFQVALTKNSDLYYLVSGIRNPWRGI